MILFSVGCQGICQTHKSIAISPREGIVVLRLGHHGGGRQNFRSIVGSCQVQLPGFPYYCECDRSSRFSHETSVFEGIVVGRL